MPKEQPNPPKLLDFTDFENGLNGWSFKFWMPKEREAIAQIKAESGYCQTNGLRIFADGLDDDGIFFVEKIFTMTEPTTYAVVSWSFAPYDPNAPIGEWPRVVYAGPVKDLARQETQHEFVWLTNEDNLHTLPGAGKWNNHHYVEQWHESLYEIQVCIGWKINFETTREQFLDNLLVILG